jgi:hypothetical protein
MKSAALVLIALSISACAQQMPSHAQQTPMPKKYDPATLSSLQGEINANSNKIDLALAAFRSVNTLTLKVNGLTLGLKALQVQVASLDVTQNSDRITRLEDKAKQEEDDRLKRDASSKADYETLMAFLKWIGGAIGVLLINVVAAHFRKNQRDGKVDAQFSAQLVATQEGVKKIEMVKEETVQIQKQTNGIHEKLQAENDSLRAQVRDAQK